MVINEGDQKQIVIITTGGGEGGEGGGQLWCGEGGAPAVNGGHHW